MERKNIDGKKIAKSLIPILIFLALMIALTIVLWPYASALGEPGGKEKFKAWIDGFGFGGWLITLGIQLLQVFVALIPGEPVEIMMGYVWGPWLGMLTCLLGIFIGTLVIYFVSKKLGMPFVRSVVGDADLAKYRFLSDKNKLEVTLFILFFIPGTPKDALTYIAPLAPVKMSKYLAIATLARIPSIITSTVVGNSLAEDKIALSLAVFVATAIISIVGIILGNRFVNKKNKIN